MWAWFEVLAESDGAVCPSDWLVKQKSSNHDESPLAEPQHRRSSARMFMNPSGPPPVALRAAAILVPGDRNDEG